MEQVRWGIISTANIVRTQLIPVIFRSSNAEMIAISSRSAKVHEVAATLNIPKAYESYKVLLEDPDIDAVYIPPPNHLHKEWVFKAATKENIYFVKSLKHCLQRKLKKCFRHASPMMLNLCTSCTRNIHR